MSTKPYLGESNNEEIEFAGFDEQGVMIGSDGSVLDILPDIKEEIKEYSGQNTRLLHLNHYDKRIEFYKNLKTRFNEFVNLKIEKIEARKNFLKEQFARYCKEYGQVGIVINDEVVKMSGQCRTDLDYGDKENQDKLLETFSKEKRFIRTKTIIELDKSAIKKNFKDTGEIPDGIETRENWILTTRKEKII